MTKHIKDKLSKLEIGFIVFIIVAIAAAWLYAWNASRGIGDVPIDTINNFDDCAAAGGSIAESYPEQCFINGQGYTRQIN